VTFTVKVSGNVGMPTGTIAFTDGTTAIAGCTAVAINASGVATCSTNRLAAGSHPIRGQYGGNGTYGAGVAGPITETVS
jgi:Bacterial Ig-like domain (group 3)